MEIKVTVPDLTRAVVGVPASGVKSIKLNGKLVWEDGKYIMNIAPSAQLLNDRIGFELAAGDWQFVAEF